jgi:AcrR family transcriptional regulator
LPRAVASVHRSETWWRRCALARGAIYQYFDSKEATLSPCWTRSFAVAGEIDWNFLIARLSSLMAQIPHDKEERAERRDVYFLGLAVALFSLAIMVSAHL